MFESRAAACFAASMVCSCATADFIGWTATVRPVDGGYLVNVFAATNNQADLLLNIAGGSIGIPTEGYVRVVNIPGGFRQGGDAGEVFRPAGGQGWTTLDSFLTVGGGFDSATGSWSGNTITEGDPPWVVTYNDTQVGGPVTVNGFNTLSNSTGFQNPYANAVPATGGWYIAGITAPARSLAPLQGIRLPFELIDGEAYGASSAAAANASHGYLVGQLWVPYLTALGTGNSIIEWKMSANLRRPGGSISNASFQFRIKGTMSPDVDGDGIPNFQDPCPDQAGPCNGCPGNPCGSCGPTPDADSDGRPDCEDNCPSVPNPGQADCNGNGIGDACEAFADCNGNGIPDSCDVANGSALDCNSNGIPDSCDIAGGLVPDCNANGIPDPCDIAFGTSGDVDANGIPDDCKPDCNGNGLPDSWEISTGRVPDCNGDLVPDTCQGAVPVDASSPNLGAPSGSEVREHDFGALPFAATPVTLVLDVRGDLDGQTEYVDLVLNGSTPRRLFGADGNDCPQTPDRAVITWSASEFNQLIAATGGLQVRVSCPPTVDPTECKGEGLTRLDLRYFGIGPKGDCDGSRSLDVCDVVGGTPDCNGNLVPDSCDIARGLAPDCNANGIPDPCEVAANPSIDCNANGIPDSCDIAAGGLAVDCDSNGRLDSCQVVENPASDCNANGIPDSCDIAAGGLVVDCDSNGRLDSCQVVENPASDCNANGIPDSCDIAAGGLVVDCDSNGRLDSCQVVENPASDCNANGKPDSCDISAGTSQDIDANGRPDECQTVRVPLEFPTIQSAIDAAPADQMRIILVSAGTYTGPIDFSGKPVIVRGTDAATTVLQGGGPAKSAVVRFSGGESAIAALERVTVRGGTTGSQPPGAPYFAGGGVYGRDSAANVRQCVIEGNSAGVGGGIFLLNCSSMVTATMIRANGASSDGGGLVALGGSVGITDCEVRSNAAGGRGGGLHFRGGRPTLTRTIVQGNNGATAAGGVSWIADDASAFLAVQDCQVTGNSAGIAQGGIGIQGAGTLPRTSLEGTSVCANVPRPNVFGAWTDLGGNSVCTCTGDLDGDERVSGDDLGAMLAQWGPCIGTTCTADLNRDGIVNGDDLGLLLGGWGPCAP